MDEQDHTGIQWATRYGGLYTERITLSQKVRAAARHIGLYALNLTRLRAERAFMRCVYCHAVFDDQVQPFRSILSRLARIGRFVTTADALAMLRGDKPIDNRYFHLSFDDGIDNIYINAFPVMQEMGIPSAVFIPTLYVRDSHDGPPGEWWFTGRVRQPIRPMLWSWVKEMADAGHDIASHTRTHARFSAISGDPAVLEAEIAGSKADIEDRLGRPCPYISWTFGSWRDIDEASLKAVRKAGYEACFAGVRGRIVPGETSIWTVPRHHFEPHWPWPHVRYFALGGHE